MKSNHVLMCYNCNGAYYASQWCVSHHATLSHILQMEQMLVLWINESIQGWLYGTRSFHILVQGWAWVLWQLHNTIGQKNWGMQCIWCFQWWMSELFSLQSSWMGRPGGRNCCQNDCRMLVIAKGLARYCVKYIQMYEQQKVSNNIILSHMSWGPQSSLIAMKLISICKTLKRRNRLISTFIIRLFVLLLETLFQYCCSSSLTSIINQQKARSKRRSHKHNIHSK